MDSYRNQHERQLDDAEEHKPARVVSDAIAESHEEFSEGNMDRNNYVCIECRSQMANEAFVKCTHQPAYCSFCAAKWTACRFCAGGD